MPLLIGIDWSQTKHDICFLNDVGAALARLTITHLAEGKRAVQSAASTQYSPSSYGGAKRISRS